jgi:hypothetical protein
LHNELSECPGPVAAFDLSDYRKGFGINYADRIAEPVRDVDLIMRADKIDTLGIIADFDAAKFVPFFQIDHGHRAFVLVGHEQPVTLVIVCYRIGELPNGYVKRNP